MKPSFKRNRGTQLSFSQVSSLYNTTFVATLDTRENVPLINVREKTKNMDKKTILIQDTEHPMNGLYKLLGGFCQPRKLEPSDDDSLTDGTHVSEPDLTSQVHVEEQHEETVVSRAVVEPDATDDEEEGEEVALPESIKVTETEPEIKATNLGRRKRVSRGLGVAMVAILAVFVTLFTLHRLGYDLADFTFTSSDTSKGSSSKPFIKIQFNERKVETVEKRQTTMASPESSDEQDTSQDQIDGVDTGKQKLEEMRTLVADFQKDSEL